MHSLSTASHGLFSTLYPGFACATLALGILILCLHYSSKRLERVALQWLVSPVSKFIATSAFTLLYAALGAIVLLFPGYVDPGEPFIMSAAYFSVHGKPVYDLLIAYGPICFLPYGLMMRLFGADIDTVKLTVLLANLVLIPMLYLGLRKLLRPTAVLLALSLILAACCMREVYTFQARGDIFIYIGVALGLIASRVRSMLLAVTFMSVALSLVMGVKITAILYLLYPCALLLRRHGWKSIAGTAIATLVLLLAPFASPNFVLSDYLHWIHAMSAAPRSRKELAGNIFTTVVLLVPIFLMFWQFLQRDRQLALRFLKERRFALAMLFVGMFGVDILGGKFGAGRHHLIPFFFVIGYLVSEIYRALDLAPPKPVSWPASLAFGWGCLGLLLLLSQAGQVRDEWVLSQREKSDALALAADVQRIIQKHPGQRIELGNGRGMDHLNDQYNAMYAAPELVFNGGAYLLDPSARTDAEAAGLQLPQQALENVRSCQSQLWLIPAGTALSSPAVFSA